MDVLSAGAWFNPQSNCGAGADYSFGQERKHLNSLPAGSSLLCLLLDDVFEHSRSGAAKIVIDHHVKRSTNAWRNRVVGIDHFSKSLKYLIDPRDGFLEGCESLLRHAN
ncbi:hypothetical protein [Bradyrhizobium sp. Tv2a-2]|uniref:hypothetical protein n=1 Tax=Bradyrhizobium sp. Tv2a-2 TaxID=113395 RepID=UPI0012EBC896|nr:hypothetical protein [Bradyrhizobium sp. Tv2a-2]